MQLPFDQILGKNNPLKLPDVAAVEAGNRSGTGVVEGTDVWRHETRDLGRDGMKNPQENGEVIHRSSDTKSFWSSLGGDEDHTVDTNNIGSVLAMLSVWVFGFPTRSGDQFPFNSGPPGPPQDENDKFFDAMEGRISWMNIFSVGKLTEVSQATFYHPAILES